MAREDQKAVLVMGCSSGIGRALARELARRGSRCFATARRGESLAELTAEGFEALRLDVDGVASIREAGDAVIARAGRIDILVNNAGRSAFAPIAEMPLDQVEEIMATNLIGQLAVTQPVVAHMAERGSGCIMNESSIVGSIPTPFGGAYSASKAALRTPSEVLRMEVEPFGIDIVVVVEPGSIRSEPRRPAARIQRSGSRPRAPHRHRCRRTGRCALRAPGDSLGGGLPGHRRGGGARRLRVDR